MAVRRSRSLGLAQKVAQEEDVSLATFIHAATFTHPQHGRRQPRQKRRAHLGILHHPALHIWPQSPGADRIPLPFSAMLYLISHPPLFLRREKGEPMHMRNAWQHSELLPSGDFTRHLHLDALFQ